MTFDKNIYCVACQTIIMIVCSQTVFAPATTWQDEFLVSCIKHHEKRDFRLGHAIVHPLEPFPAIVERQAGYTLDNLVSPVNQTHNVLDCGRKPQPYQIVISNYHSGRNINDFEGFWQFLFCCHQLVGNLHQINS